MATARIVDGTLDLISQEGWVNQGSSISLHQHDLSATARATAHEPDEVDAGRQLDAAVSTAIPIDLGFTSLCDRRRVGRPSAPMNRRS